MTFKCERHFIRDRFDVFMDLNEKTGERRISVYRGETLLAIEFIQPIDRIIDNLVHAAHMRAPKFPAGSR